VRKLLSVLLGLLPLAAAADVVRMADGTTREGRVVETTDKEVVLEVGQGGVTLTVRLPRSQVLSIQQKPTAGAAVMAEYVARLSAALKSNNPDHWHALALWCRQRPGFRDKAPAALQHALDLDPNHEPTRRALGHVRVNGTWMTRKQAVQAIAPELEQNARLRELELQAQLEQARAAAAQAEARAKALEAKLAELRKDVEDLRKRLAMPPLPADYYRPRVIYRPIIILPRRYPPPKGHPPGKGKGRGEPPARHSPPAKDSPPANGSPPAKDSPPAKGSPPDDDAPPKKGG